MNMALMQYIIFFALYYTLLQIGKSDVIFIYLNVINKKSGNYPLSLYKDPSYGRVLSFPSQQSVIKPYFAESKGAPLVLR